jgi:DNA ligase 1
VKEFAALLDRLAYEPQRNAKLALLAAYFRETPDPDRGIALAAMTGTLAAKHAKPALVRALAEVRVDAELFRLSYDYVGDLAETVALIWPAKPGANRAPSLGEIVETLDGIAKADVPARLESWLDALDATGRWALIKLLTGGLRVGVSARLAKMAVARLGSLDPDEIELVWPGLASPYTELFAWAEGKGPRPDARIVAPFRPAMLAHALDERARAALKAGDFAAEWKWDGVRVQLVREGESVRLYTRTGEDISAAFPDVTAALAADAALDGELLVLREGVPGSFNELQQRLNRKTVTKPMLAKFPCGLRAYDLLAIGGDDLRPLPFAERRIRLEALIAAQASGRLDLSPLVAFATLDELDALRRAAPPGVEGLMLKRQDAPYLPGRPMGLWWKWKREPFNVDAVLLYAQRGHGKRSSFYSDYTFGVWRGETLVPVGKAYSGFTDEELKRIDRFVRENTVQSFGPVREVTHTREAGLVLEIAFEGLARSSRHKSGLAMRFPRIARLRWDKPPSEAGTVEELERLL